jgi:hypothetical protein
MLDRCKAVAKRSGLDPAKFDLKTFRSSYATRMLRQGFDVCTVQHWVGHKSLETTMRYLVPAADVHGKLEQVKIPAPPKKSPAPRKLSHAKRARPERDGPCNRMSGMRQGQQMHKPDCKPRFGWASMGFEAEVAESAVP